MAYNQHLLQKQHINYQQSLPINNDSTQNKSTKTLLKRVNLFKFAQH